MKHKAVKIGLTALVLAAAFGALLFNTLEATNQRGELVYHAELVGFSKLRDYKMPLKLRMLLALTRLPVLGKVITKRTG